MIKSLNLKAKLQIINITRYLKLLLYTFENPADCTFYSIMRPYKNYFNKP